MKVLGVSTVLIIYNIFAVAVIANRTDIPCAARSIYNRSVVCVCNITYCDEITRDAPERGMVLTYTSSESGARFKKGFGIFHTIDNRLSNDSGKLSLVVNPERKYQTIKGFGGAVTDSAGIVWKTLPARAQRYLIESYFGNKGIEYNLVRLPIGASDFSVRTYSLDDYSGDVSLEKFSLQEEDYNYKIPMIREAMNVSTSEIQIVASAWSPPRWMKETTPQNPVCGYLKYQYFQTYAEYLCKFVASYESVGISIWAVTTGNEPSLAIWSYTITSCLGWSLSDLGNWISNNLGPTVRNSTYKDLILLAMDDQRFTIPLTFEPMVLNFPEVLDYIDGVAVHYYADSYVVAGLLDYVTDRYNKFVISTEASAGFDAQTKQVDLGSWDRARQYARDIIEDLSNNVVGWVDWNICLNTEGGPNVNRNYVDSPVIVDAENGEFLKQPMFYILGHFSKFIPRGSQRIDVQAPSCETTINYVAFLTPTNTIVVVVCNRGTARSIALQLRDKEVVIYVEENSMTTAEFVNE